MRVFTPRYIIKYDLMGFRIKLLLKLKSNKYKICFFENCTKVIFLILSIKKNKNFDYSRCEIKNNFFQMTIS